jgi:hypothetical protein
MDRSSEQAWITSLQQHRLGVENVVYVTSGKGQSQMQFPEASVSGPGQPTDTLEYRPEVLAWEVALLAQSSAYLALELQIFAERLSQMPILCPESTYRRLFDSLVTFRALLDAMVRNYKQTNGNENDGLVPALSTPLVEAIRSMLARETVSGSGGYTISSERVVRRHTGDAGDTR